MGRFLLISVLFCTAHGWGQDLIWHSPVPSASQARDLLKGICPHGIQSVEDGSALGCKPCPEFTTVGENAELASRESFHLLAAFYGSFSAPGMEEAAASFGGCEPHAAGYGGTILLRRFAEGWNMVHYRQALITGACQKYPLKGGRDLLLCEAEDHHMTGASQSIFTYDFSVDQDSQGTGVFGVIDTRQACGTSAVWGSIDKLELHDLNGDGKPDLSVWISVGQGTFQSAGGPCADDTSHAPLQSYKLDFLFQRETNGFVPAASSAAMVDHFTRLFKEAGDAAVRAIKASSGP